MTGDYATDLTPDKMAGTTVVGKTTYKVWVLKPKPDLGLVARFAMVGPRGSMYFVTDHGPKYLLNSVCLGGGVSWRAAPRPLRGLDRSHLAAFYPDAVITPLAGKAVTMIDATTGDARKGRIYF